MVIHPSGNLGLWLWIARYPQPQSCYRVGTVPIMTPAPLFARLLMPSLCSGPPQSSLIIPLSKLVGDSLQGEGKKKTGSRGQWQSEVAEAAVCRHRFRWIWYCSADLFLFVCSLWHGPSGLKGLWGSLSSTTSFTDEETVVWGEDGKEESSIYGGLIICFDHTFQVPQPAEWVAELGPYAFIYYLHTHITQRKGLIFNT